MKEILYCSVVLVIFIFFSVCGVRLEKNIEKEEMLNRLNSLRSIFAIEIVIGHVIRYEKTILYPMGKFMIISVAFFFFVSAFGMAVSYQKKENYLKKFLLRKPLYLLGLSSLIYLFNASIDLLHPAELGYVNRNFIYCFFETTNWYLFELMIFYVLFYVVYKYIPKYRIWVMIALTLVMVMIFWWQGAIQGWYSSAFAFPLGLYVGEKFEIFSTFLQSVKGKIIIVVATMFGMCSLLLSTDSLLGMVFLRNIMCIAGVLILCYLVIYFKPGNKVNMFFNMYSTEIYLTQFVWLNISRNEGWNYKVALPIVFFGTLLSAWLIHPVTKWLRNKMAN